MSDKNSIILAVDGNLVFSRHPNDLKPRRVARTGILAMLRHRSSVVAGILNKLVVFVFRFTPRRMQRGVMQRVFSG